MKEQNVFKCKFCGDEVKENNNRLWQAENRKCVKCNNDKFWYHVIEVIA